MISLWKNICLAIKIKIKDSERSLISETVSIEGTINSSGAIDVAGLVKVQFTQKSWSSEIPAQ